MLCLMCKHYGKCRELYGRDPGFPFCECAWPDDRYTTFQKFDIQPGGPKLIQVFNTGTEGKKPLKSTKTEDEHGS